MAQSLGNRSVTTTAALFGRLMETKCWRAFPQRNITPCSATSSQFANAFKNELSLDDAKHLPLATVIYTDSDNPHPKRIANDRSCSAIALANDTAAHNNPLHREAPTTIAGAINRTETALRRSVQRTIETQQLANSNMLQVRQQDAVTVRTFVSCIPIHDDTSKRTANAILVEQIAIAFKLSDIAIDNATMKLKLNVIAYAEITFSIDMVCACSGDMSH